MFKDIADILQNLELLKQRPGLLVALVCIFAFLCTTKPIFDFLNSSYDFFHKIHYRKYLKYKEIYESSIANEENKSIAKAKIDSFQFKQLTKIDANKELRTRIILLANQAQDKNIWIHISSSIKYLTVEIDGDLVSILPESTCEGIWRYLNYFFASICFMLTK